MYKTRIKQWALDKKSKENEMRAIVRKSKQRTDLGKRTTFRIRGRPVGFEKIASYWERKGMSIDDVIAERTASVTPEAVDYFTPLPSPIMTPELLATPERVLISIQDYFRGSFDSRT